MEDDSGIDVQDESISDISELEDDVLATKPKSGSSVTDGTSNT